MSISNKANERNEKNERTFNGLRVNKKAFESRWNNNCYTYAINQPVSPYTGENYGDWNECQPNLLGGLEKDEDFSYWRLGGTKKYGKLIEGAKLDLNGFGFTIQESTYEEVGNGDCWKVAVCFEEDEGHYGDYHWYRQNLNGTWSHKKGRAKVSKVDAKGKVIHNPQECNRGIYTEFGGFFMIRKLEVIQMAV